MIIFKEKNYIIVLYDLEVTMRKTSGCSLFKFSPKVENSSFHLKEYKSKMYRNTLFYNLDSFRNPESKQSYFLLYLIFKTKLSYPLSILILKSF